MAKLPWKLDFAERELAAYTARYGAGHPEVRHLRACLEAIKAKYAALPPIECILIDEQDGIYPEYLWEEEEQRLFSAIVFFWPEVGSDPDRAEDQPGVDVGRADIQRLN